MAKQNISIPEISETFSKNDFFNEAATKMNLSGVELTNYLWQSYHPSNIWMIYSGVAVSAVVFLWIYDRFILGKN